VADFKPGQDNDNKTGCVLLAIGALVFLFWVIARNDPGTSTVNGSNAYDVNSTATAEVPVIPSPPQPLSPQAARHGYGQFQMVAAASVPGSSEIFSRNCYEALGKPLDWHQLDRCGAFDALASRWTDENNDIAGEDDLIYFQSETAATRYLHAATAGGLTAAEADNRWTALQALARKVHLAKRPAPVEATPVDDAQDAASATQIVDENGNPVTLPSAVNENTSE
jgi:hypothetical protein